jgi:hypothetical protein
MTKDIENDWKSITFELFQKTILFKKIEEHNRLKIRLNSVLICE